jgi:RecG-like helicase
MVEIQKRATAYKLKIGDIVRGNSKFDGDRFVCLTIEDKDVFRVNVVANIVDKYFSEGSAATEENTVAKKAYLVLTIDDASAQIKLKLFGDEAMKFKELSQGDTITVIGTLRFYNSEVYINPEIIKKTEPAYLLVRKLELEKNKPIDKKEAVELRDKIIEMIKREDDNGGVEIDKIMMELKNDPELINGEVAKLLEEGMIYEPRPGKIRILG